MRGHLRYIKRWFVALHALPRIHKKLLQLLGEKPDSHLVTNEAINNLTESAPRAIRDLRRDVEDLKIQLARLGGGE